LVLMVGDKDTGVDGSGARVLLARLELANFPASRIKLIIVRSNKTFKATHVSVLENNQGARRAFWVPTDRLIDSGGQVGGSADQLGRSPRPTCAAAAHRRLSLHREPRKVVMAREAGRTLGGEMARQRRLRRRLPGRPGFAGASV